MAVTEFTAAISGAGKSYLRCARFLSHEFLPDTHRGIIYTNFPVNIDAMVSYVAEKNPALVASVLRDRIHVIPQDELDRWLDESSGPWEYFRDKDLQGNRIAIDEIHNFVNQSSSKAYVSHWRKFLGELRHQGAEFECLTQNESKVHKLIKDEAGLKRSLFNSESRRDFIFGIRMYDWYILRGFFTGSYSSTIFEYEYLPIEGKWKLSHSGKFTLDPNLFPLYDSYSAPIAGGTKAKGRVYEFQSKSFLGLLGWFVRRNWFQFFSRSLLISFVVWLCFFGGGATIIQAWSAWQVAAVRPPPAAAASSAPVVVPVIAPGASASSSAVKPLTGKILPLVPSASSSAVALEDPVLAQLRRDLAAVVEQVGKVDAENSRLKRELALSSELSAIFSDRVSFRSGYSYSIGDVIVTGHFKGRKIHEISFKNRSVILDDGSILYLLR